MVLKIFFLQFFCLVILISSSSLSDFTNTSNGIDLKLQQAEANPVIVKVSKDASSKFKNVQDALNSIQPPNNKRVIVSIATGVYREKIVIPITLPFVTFLGDAKGNSKITWNDSYSTIGSDGKPLETYKSASVAVEADYFIAINMIFENTAYFPTKVEQAVAIRVTGNKAAFYNCSFYGVQDTLYDHKGLHYFKNCYIQGAVDFVFGDGTSLYEGCTLNSTAKGVSYITAQQRSDRSSESGFSFVNSTVKGSGLVYLGRPWANYSRVVFSYTYMDKNVLPKGWDNHFDDEKNVTKLYYGEYKCFGPGSNFTERAPWVRRLTDEEAQQFISIQFILGNTWLNNPHN